MGLLAVTAANCIVTGTYGKTLCQLGETVTAGQVLYQKASDSKFWKAKANGTAEESGYGVTMAIALGGGVASQFVGGLTSGTITSGATHTKGYTVYLATGAVTPGSFTETEADLTTTMYKTYVGYATTTAIMSVSFNATGITIT